MTCGITRPARGMFTVANPRGKAAEPLAPLPSPLTAGPAKEAWPGQNAAKGVGKGEALKGAHIHPTHADTRTQSRAWRNFVEELRFASQSVAHREHSQEVSARFVWCKK